MSRLRSRGRQRRPPGRHRLGPLCHRFSNHALWASTARLSTRTVCHAIRPVSTLMRHARPATRARPGQGPMRTIFRASRWRATTSSVTSQLPARSASAILVSTALAASSARRPAASASGRAQVPRSVATALQRPLTTASIRAVWHCLVLREWGLFPTSSLAAQPATTAQVARTRQSSAPTVQSPRAVSPSARAARSPPLYRTPQGQTVRRAPASSAADSHLLAMSSVQRASSARVDSLRLCHAMTATGALLGRLSARHAPPSPPHQAMTTQHASFCRVST